MPQASGVWAQVCPRALAYDGRSVISHEMLGLSTEEHIERVVRSLAPARLQVIVMARSLAAMLASLWQESVKSVGATASAGRPSWPRNATPVRRSPTLSSSSSGGLATYPQSRSTSSRCRPPAPGPRCCSVVSPTRSGSTRPRTPPSLNSGTRSAISAGAWPRAKPTSTGCVSRK